MGCVVLVCIMPRRKREGFCQHNDSSGTFQAANKVKVSGNNARAFLHFSAIKLRMAKTTTTTTTTKPPSFGCFTLLGNHSRTNPTLLLSHESPDD
jgi:hypothetical protein